MANLSCQLEATKDRAGDAVGQVHLVGAEWQLVDTRNLEVVGAVIAGLGPVQVEVAGIRIGRTAGTRTRTIICIVECMRPGIVQAVLIPTTCIARQLRLQWRCSLR